MRLSLVILSLIVAGGGTQTLAATAEPSSPSASITSDDGIFPAHMTASFDALPASGTPDWLFETQPPHTEDVSLLPPGGSLASSTSEGVDAQPAGAQRPVAIEYSDAYNVRRKIHLYASFATLPLFGVEWALGNKLYDGTATENTRSTHGGVAAGIGVLFGVNTVTGVWNMWEARKDPNHRTRRLVHGLLMLGADAGFVATGMLAPDEEGNWEGEGGGNRSLHRTVALTSMAVATAGYLMMLFSR